MINIYHNPSKYSIAVIQPSILTLTLITQSISFQSGKRLGCSRMGRGKSRVELGPKYNLTLI